MKRKASDGRPSRSRMPKLTRQLWESRIRFMRGSLSPCDHRMMRSSISKNAPCKTPPVNEPSSPKQNTTVTILVDRALNRPNCIFEYHGESVRLGARPSALDLEQIRAQFGIAPEADLQQSKDPILSRMRALVDLSSLEIIRAHLARTQFGLCLPTWGSSISQSSKGFL